MKILVPKAYAGGVWVALQQYVFSAFDEADTIYCIEEEDVIKYGVDALFVAQYGKSIYDIALAELGDEAFKEEKDLRIYDHVRSSDLLSLEASDINYKSQVRNSFDWKPVFKYGRLLRTIGYEMDANGNHIPMKPVVLINFDYDLDVLTPGYVSKRKKTVRFYKKDGSLSYSRKTMVKNYVDFRGPTEAERRRRNIVNFLQKEIQDFILAGGASQAQATATSQAFIDTIKQEVSDYILWAYRNILTAVQNHTSPLMDGVVAPGVTVRDFILARVDYWTYEEVQGGQYKGSML